MKKTIPVANWQANDRQKQLVLEVLESGRLTYGDKTRQFEEAFAKIHHRKHALFTSSGTAALQIALHAYKEEYNWQDGDEVIIPALTFVATMNVVLYNNLTPVLVDINLATLNINASLIRDAITPKTRAIMPVHLLGQSADMDAILEIAKEYNLKVIEDSCESMYVQKDGHPVGSRGDVACYSTYLAHLLVTGVGGFITTNDDRMATIMRSMMFHGRDETYLTMDDNDKEGADFETMYRNRFRFTRQGYSARATELEAAIGIEELSHWRMILAYRQHNAKLLRRLLKNLPIDFPWSDEKEHAFMLFPMVFPSNSTRNIVQGHLEQHGVHTRHIMPLTNQPIVKRLLGADVENDYPRAANINRCGLLIGCHEYLEDSDIRYISKVIHDCFKKKL